MLTKEYFLEKNILLSLAENPILENVKYVTVGRIMREGCLRRILREFILHRFKVTEMARINWGRNRKIIDMALLIKVSERGL